MALARLTTFTLHGVEPQRVEVECDVRRGLPALSIVGLGDRAVREARERVTTAIRNAGFAFPDSRITVNLAPAWLRKSGPAFDLGIACAILVASGQIDRERLERLAVFGELSLGADVQPTRGALAVAEGVLAHGLAGVLLPPAQVTEAALVPGIEVLGLARLADLAGVLEGDAAVVVAPPPDFSVVDVDPGIDLADVRGHAVALRALTIAAAGGHNLLFHGPPGTGKTMLARRLPTILPPLGPAEALAVTRIRSITGQPNACGLATLRPFRAPHHGISVSGMVGGGAIPQPGEVTLAHHGVLFLDELSEFPRPVLEALRQPLEDGSVAIVRGQRAAVYPSRCMLVAATNPCPCGSGGDACRCNDAEKARYRRRLSGPLLDRIDLQTHVARPPVATLGAPAVTTSAAERERVLAARERQADRLEGTGLTANSQLTPALLRRHVALDAAAGDALDRAYDRYGLSARARDRVLRVARTIADLDDSASVRGAHLAQAIQLRLDGASDPADPQRAGRPIRVPRARTRQAATPSTTTPAP